MAGKVKVRGVDSKDQRIEYECIHIKEFGVYACRIVEQSKRCDEFGDCVVGH